MNNNVLKLDSEMYKGWSFDSKWMNSDYHIWKVSESKTHYSLWVSDSDDLLSIRCGNKRFLSTLLIRITKKVKNNGLSLVTFHLSTHYKAKYVSEFDEVELGMDSFRSPHTFSSAIHSKLDGFFSKMAGVYNEYINRSK